MNWERNIYLIIFYFIMNFGSNNDLNKIIRYGRCCWLWRLWWSITYLCIHYFFFFSSFGLLFYFFLYFFFFSCCFKLTFSSFVIQISYSKKKITFQSFIMKYIFLYTNTIIYYFFFSILLHQLEVKKKILEKIQC